MRRMIRNLAVLFPRGVIRWLLRDEFSDTRAAGAVDGTPATPGPGTRTVQDPDGVVSISGGNYVSAGGSTVFAQNIYYPAITRVAGTVLVAIKTSTLPGGIGLDSMGRNRVVPLQPLWGSMAPTSRWMPSLLN